jgi:dTDP-4-dehydrorhamnose 3,5-epimerase
MLNKYSPKIQETGIPGCLEILPYCFEDERGRFVKLFNEVAGGDYIPEPFAEEFYSVSTSRVLRGLHFQVPPMDVTKLVTCLAGEVLDVVVDLRRGSPTYGQYEAKLLSEANRAMLFVPSGLAHGFYVTGESALLLYKVNKVYSPEHDSGIHWQSLPIPWPDADPVLSGRDQKFPTFQEYQSPFIYKAPQ